MPAILIKEKELALLKPLAVRVIEGEKLPKDLSKQDKCIVQVMVQAYEDGKLSLNWLGGVKVDEEELQERKRLSHARQWKPPKPETWLERLLAMFR